jgi:predicted nucleic acid-binding Zn ribbon protein
VSNEDTASPEQPDGQPLKGPDLARAVLDAAKAKRPASRRTTERDYRPRGYSGPGTDPRDPAKFGDVLARLIKARGWQQPAAEGTVFGAWEKVVGPEISARCRPVKLENRELTVEAESTAWATQLRALAPTIIKRIAAEVGNNVVVRVRIHGPAAPSWSKGPRRVKGSGPGDTYG